MSAAQPSPDGTGRVVVPLELIVEPEPAELMSSRLGRGVYLVLGFLSLGVGIAGYVVPLLPGTVFLLIATYFFFRSSERMYHWILNHPWFGSLVRNYLAGYGIPRRIKVYAVTLIIVSFATSIAFAVSGQLPRLVLVAIAIGVVAFILSRPTTEVVLAET
ncbi:MAG: YbaN family protein [Actinomycetota bacterium]|nr:YbaN family protein [Actinomycetota bacterium]